VPEQKPATPDLFRADGQRHDVGYFDLIFGARALKLRAARRKRVEDDGRGRRADRRVVFEPVLILNTQQLAAAFAERLRPERACAHGRLLAGKAALREVEAAGADVERPEILVVGFETQVVAAPVVEAHSQRAVVVVIRVVDQAADGAGGCLRVDRLILFPRIHVTEEIDARPVPDIAGAVEIHAAALARRIADGKRVAGLRGFGTVPGRERRRPRLGLGVGDDLDESGCRLVILGVEGILPDANLLNRRRRRQAPR
jgi:hypothetical protein